jgi:hypothetical protein
MVPVYCIRTTFYIVYTFIYMICILHHIQYVFYIIYNMYNTPQTKKLLFYVLNVY